MQNTVTEQSTLDELTPLLLNAVQVAYLLSVSKDTIQRMNASGKTPLRLDSPGVLFAGGIRSCRIGVMRDVLIGKRGR